MLLQRYSVLNLCLIPLTFSLMSIDAYGWFCGGDREYGKIPCEIKICSQFTNAIELSSESSIEAGIDAEAGPGLEKVLKATAKFMPSARLGSSIGLNTNAALEYTHCTNLSEIDPNTLSVIDRERFESLFNSNLGGQIDQAAIAPEIIDNAIGLNMTAVSANAALTMSTTLGALLDELLFAEGKLDLNKKILDVVDLVKASQSVVPTRMYNAMIDIDNTIARHIQNIDVIGKSCRDLDNGKIEHLGEQLTQQMRDICGEFNFLIDDASVAIRTVSNAVENFPTLMDGVAVLQDGLTQLQSAGDFASTAVAQSIDSVDGVLSGIEGVINDVGAVAIDVESVIDDVESGIGQGLDQVTVVSGAINNVSGNIKTVVEDSEQVTTLIEPAVNTIASAGNNLVGEATSKVSEAFCEITISLVLSEISFADLPIIGSAICD